MYEFRIVHPVTWWNDLMTYDGTEQDYDEDAFWLGILDTLGFPASTFRKTREDKDILKTQMDMFGVGWSDIKYPTRTSAFNDISSASGRTLNFVSDNVRRLYSKF